jgi:hypothetical protein
MLKILLSLVTLLSFSFAQADQCQYVDKATAERAFAIIEKANALHELCQPCGQVGASKLSFTSVAIKEVGYQSFWGIFVDGKNIDLAYTYVDGVNLADLAQCPADGVDHKLKAYTASDSLELN